MIKTKTATVFECIQQIQERDGGFKETPRKSQGYSQQHQVVGTCATPGGGVGQSTNKISTAVEPTDDELNAAKQASLEAFRVESAKALKTAELEGRELSAAEQASLEAFRVEEQNKWNMEEGLHQVLNNLTRLGFNILDPASDGHCGPASLAFTANLDWGVLACRKFVGGYLLRLSDAEKSCLTNGGVTTQELAVAWVKKYCAQDVSEFGE